MELRKISSRGQTAIPKKNREAAKLWRWAYHEEVLQDLCLLRTALLNGGVREPVAVALRGIILGALHGPVGRTKRSYFSNQFPRTYAPKPRYSVKFWGERKLRPPQVNVIDIIGEGARRYYGTSHAAFRERWWKETAANPVLWIEHAGRRNGSPM